MVARLRNVLFFALPHVNIFLNLSLPKERERERVRLNWIPAYLPPYIRYQSRKQYIHHILTKTQSSKDFQTHILRTGVTQTLFTISNTQLYTRYKMFTTRILTLLAIATSALVQAHTVITYPGWRGDNLITNETFPYGMQWMYPCE